MQLHTINGIEIESVIDTGDTYQVTLMDGKVAGVPKAEGNRHHRVVLDWEADGGEIVIEPEEEA